MESAPCREKNWRTEEAWVGVDIGGYRTIVAREAESVRESEEQVLGPPD